MASDATERFIARGPTCWFVSDRADRWIHESAATAAQLAVGSMMTHTRVPRLARHVRQFLGLVALVMLVSAGCCNNCGDPPAVGLPVPKSLEVIPHNVVVTPPANDTAILEIQALIRTAAGELIGESFGHKPKFAVTGGGSPLDVTVTHKHRGTLRVAKAGTALVLDTASAELVDTARSDPNTEISVNRPLAGPDTLRARYEDSSPPSVALLDGWPRGGDHCVGLTLAFVRVAVIGDLVAPCDPGSHVAVFSSKRAMVLRPVSWFTNADTVDVVGEQRAPDTLFIAVHVAVAREPEESRTLAQLRNEVLTNIPVDVEHANALLQTNRAGIVVKVLPAFPVLVDGQLGDYSCGAVTPTSGVLNVFYVNRYREGAIGRYCPPAEGQPEGVIYLTRAASSAGFVHELGHALALLSPAQGHTDGIRDFTEANVMRAAATDAAYTDRWHFSLGQVFRMNAAAASWMNERVGAAPAIRQGRPTLDCQCDPYVHTPCPALAQDIVFALTNGPALPKSDCNDSVYLYQTNLSDTAYALLTGRPWRTDECNIELPGLPFRRASNALRLFFPNVESAVTCPSRLTVFFQSHAMLLRNIGEAVWRPELDIVGINDEPQPLRQVPVHLWFKSGQNHRDDDRARADQVFGARIEDRVNLTGIRFAWKPKDVAGLDAVSLLQELLGSGCVPPTSQAAVIKLDSINVYYVPAAALPPNDGGYTCRAPNKNTYFVFLAETGTPELAHHLGHTLALQDVTDDRMAGRNLMWRDAVARGGELTLGQVFRMNVDKKSWLQRLGGPPAALDCDDCDRDKCPGLYVDFRQTPE